MINVCGVDRDGRPIIIVAMAENKIIFIKKKTQKFFKMCQLSGFSKNRLIENFSTCILAACRFPNNNSKEHDLLLKYIKFKLGESKIYLDKT